MYEFMSVFLVLDTRYKIHLNTAIDLPVTMQICDSSTTDTAYQKEAVDRLHLPFALLSDNKLLLTEALRLPTFVLKDSTLLKRITIIIKDGVIRKIFYPVFPPNASALEVIKFLKSGQHHQW